MTDPTTKNELLTAMQSGYDNFEALLAPLSVTQLTTPGVNGEWSIKDILAHIATWQKRMAMRLEAIARNEDGHLEPEIKNEEQMHAFNAATFDRYRSDSLDEVLSDFRAATRRLRAAVEAVDEDSLFATDRFAWMGGEPLWKNIGGNSFWHYEEHAPMITEWLAGQHI